MRAGSRKGLSSGLPRQSYHGELALGVEKEAQVSGYVLSFDWPPLSDQPPVDSDVESVGEGADDAWTAGLDLGAGEPPLCWGVQLDSRS